MMTPLGNVADVSTGYAFRKKVQPEEGGDVVLVQLKDMDGAEGVSGTGTVTLRNEGGKYERYLLQDGDLLFQSRGSRHPVAVVGAGIRGIAATGLHTIRPHRWAGTAGLSRLVAEPPYFASDTFKSTRSRAGTYIPFVSKADLLAFLCRCRRSRCKSESSRSIDCDGRNGRCASDSILSPNNWWTA